MTNGPLHISNVQKRVLAQIKEQRVTMVPRAYFVVRAVSAIVLTILIFFLSVGILNYILFSVRASHHLPLLSLGLRGVFMFFLFFPWFLLFFDLLFFMILQRLLRTFSFVYKIPLLYILGIVLVSVACLAGFLDYFRASDHVLRRGYLSHIPILSNIYGDAHEHMNPEHGVCPCVVLATSTQTITLMEHHPDGTTRIVHAVLPSTVSTSSLSIGENIFLVGTFDHGILYASDMRIWDPDTDGDSDPTLPSQEPKNTP